jgi:hypothetical protein
MRGLQARGQTVKYAAIAPCLCSAYNWPHRTGAGACSRRQALRTDGRITLGPAKCSAHQHRSDCRPGRPLCRYRRKAIATGLCHCDAMHFPHRWGGGRCAGGEPDPLLMEAELHRPVRRSA